MPSLFAVALRVALLTLVVTGVLYPFAVTGLAVVLFSARAQGSWLTDERGQVVGSELLKHMNFSHEDGERLWLAIQEGIGNAMRHGNKLDKRKPIQVTFTPLAQRLEIRITDTGQGVDLARLPNPNLPENLLKPCGRGVYFMKQVMDTVEMETSGQGSTLVLVKLRRHLEAAAEVPAELT